MRHFAVALLATCLACGTASAATAPEKWGSWTNKGTISVPGFTPGTERDKPKFTPPPKHVGWKPPHHAGPKPKPHKPGKETPAPIPLPAAGLLLLGGLAGLAVVRRRRET